MTGEQTPAPSSPRDSEDGSVTLEQQPKVCLEILSVLCILHSNIKKVSVSSFFLFSIKIHLHKLVM